MSQHDMVIDDGPGLTVRTDFNAAIQALASMNAGPTEPTTKYAGQFWLDTTTAPNGTVRMRNLANTSWIKLFDPGGSTPSILLSEQASPPVTVADQIAIYSKDVAGITEFFMRRSSNGAEVQLSGGVPGVYKISEGAAATGLTSLDIPIPTGYRKFQFHVNRVYPNTDAQFLYARVSLDGGATYPNTGYSWGYDLITQAASGGWTQLGNGADSGMAFSGSQSNTANNAGFLEVDFPEATTDVPRLMSRMFHRDTRTTAPFVAGAQVQVRSAGLYGGGTGRITNLRLYYVGTLNHGGWQLNGIK